MIDEFINALITYMYRYRENNSHEDNKSNNGCNLALIYGKIYGQHQSYQSNYNSIIVNIF